MKTDRDLRIEYMSRDPGIDLAQIEAYADANPPGFGETWYTLDCRMREFGHAFADAFIRPLLETLPRRKS